MFIDFFTYKICVNKYKMQHKRSREEDQSRYEKFQKYHHKRYKTNNSEFSNNYYFTSES